MAITRPKTITARVHHPARKTLPLSSILLVTKAAIWTRNGTLQPGRLESCQLLRSLGSFQLPQACGAKEPICFNSHDWRVTYARSCRASFFFTQSRIHFCFGFSGCDDLCVPARVERRFSLGRRRLHHQ